MIWERGSKVSISFRNTALVDRTEYSAAGFCELDNEI
jgi:hypothetical protein